jgi:plastocyanin
MRAILIRVLIAAAACTACVTSAGCRAEIGDINVNIKDPHVTFDTDVDVDNVMQGDTVPIHVEVENVYLVDPNADPPPEHEDDAGHLQIYLDNFDSDPLLITANVEVNVTIPIDTPPGEHTIKCRVHKHDGTPTSAVFELKITVKAKVSTG